MASAQKALTRVIGIDPGLNATGYGVIECRRGGVKLIEAGVIRMPRSRGDNLPARLEMKSKFSVPRLLIGYNTVRSGDPDSYALDVLSVVEATLDDPRQIVAAQENKARGEAVGEMKRDGVEYEERMERLQEISYPKPLEDVLLAVSADQHIECPLDLIA